jgi:C4-dicarboxylate transporter, DctQ subunit
MNNTSTSASHELLPEPEVELPPSLAPLRAVERLLHNIERALVVLLVVTLVGLSFFQIVIRNLSNLGWEWAAHTSTSLIWAEPFLRHMVLLVAFLGASLAARQGRHLHIDVVSRLLPPRPRALLKAIIDVFSAVVCFLLAHATIGLIQSDPDSVAFHVGSVEVKAWLFCTAILLGFALVGLRFLIRGAEDWWRSRTGLYVEEVPPL